MATTNQTKHFENNDGDSSLWTVEIIHCIFNAFLIPISITGNTLVLVAILRSPSLRSPSIILLCCLAVSDLFVGILVQPSFIVYHLTKSSNFYKAMTATSFVACGVSLWTMGAIAVDRCIALHYHLRYVQLVTTRRAIYLSTTLWIVAFIFLFLTLLENHVFAVTVAVSTATCLLTCLACYVRIYFIVRRHQLQIMVQQRAVAGNINGNNHNMREKYGKKHFYLLHCTDNVLYTSISYLVSCSDFPNLQMANGMDRGQLFAVHELINQPVSILLASPRASRGSCKHGKADILQVKLMSLTTIKMQSKLL